MLKSFFYNNIKKEIYVKQFIKYILKKHLNKVYKFNKTLYNLN